MRVEPYLMLSGRTEEAITFYQQAIDAKVVMMMRFDESPELGSTGENCGALLPPNWGRKIMHAGFMVGDTLVMASDGMTATPTKFEGVSLSLTTDTEADTKRLFNALSADGNICMPIGKTFWSPCFGMCSDKFGVSWMIGLEGDPLSITQGEQP